MNKELFHRRRKAEGGFTLIELLVVVLIIGILAAIAVPQYFKVVEKGKAAEALTTLDSIRGANERYLANTGQYCTTANFGCPGWDMAIPALKYFATPSAIAAGTTSPSWTAALKRNSTPAVYGGYTVTYDVEPSKSPSVTCDNASCMSDLMPQ